MSVTGDDHWAGMAAVELAAGKDKDSWATSRAVLSIRTPADPATAPRIRGYTIADYTWERARVLIYTSFPDSSMAVNTAIVTWVAQDCRLLPPDPSDAAPAVKAVGAVDTVVKREAPK
ncbi:hypothetical protein ACQP1G_16680 [Nocardia sp. CA-107356]|uniref:hypothetical protein n=1 Tax=Nocardia sp. CA-107356 TaxID=3239972 RepID=UPI003D8AB337